MATSSAPKITILTFSPAWGLPTAGPFGIKLEACLRMLGVEYERRFEDDNRKGPKRKSPWMQDGIVTMGDTELILQYVERKSGAKLDADLTPGERARAHVLCRMLEEHFHQVFEYELMTSQAGAALFRDLLSKAGVPRPLLGFVSGTVRRGFQKHLFERGIARHAPADIEAMGRDDVDALVEWLGDRRWFISEGPTKTDASALGLLAAAIRSPIESPVCSYARSQPSLVRFVERGLEHFFPELSQGVRQDVGVLSSHAAA